MQQRVSETRAGLIKSCFAVQQRVIDEAGDEWRNSFASVYQQKADTLTTVYDVNQGTVSFTVYFSLTVCMCMLSTEQMGYCFQYLGYSR